MSCAGQQPKLGGVYAIQAEDGGPIKIGYSRGANGRLDTLQTGNPKKLVLLANCYAPYEDLCHHYLRDDRIFGEWFRPTDRVMMVVDAIKRQAATPEEHILTNHIYHNDYGSVVWYRMQKLGWSREKAWSRHVRV